MQIIGLSLNPAQKTNTANSLERTGKVHFYEKRRESRGRFLCPRYLSRMFLPR